MRPFRGVPAIAALLCLCASRAGAHAVVYPKTSLPGAYEKYVLRVPNEKASTTVMIEIAFPADARVISFADVPGWRMQPVLDSAKRIVGARWVGSLPAERFVELPFVAVNPRGTAHLVWPVMQVYEGGDTVRWNGAPDSKTPASATDITSPSPAPLGGRGPMLVAFAALALSLIALGLALRRGADPRPADA